MRRLGVVGEAVAARGRSRAVLQIWACVLHSNCDDWHELEQPQDPAGAEWREWEQRKEKGTER